MTTPLKRQPRGKEPLEQRSYKLPIRCTRWLRSQARKLGITEAHFLKELVENAMEDESKNERPAA